MQMVTNTETHYKGNVNTLRDINVMELNKTLIDLKESAIKPSTQAEIVYRLARVGHVQYLLGELGILPKELICE